MATEGEFRDGLIGGPARGRGAGLNPGNRFEDVRLHVLGEHLEEVLAEHPDGRQVVTRVYADRTKSLLNRVESPDLPMRWTINPYRGCEHGCIYCYARPGHETLGLSCGLDFETKITAKRDAAAILRRELMRPSWKGEPVSMSGVTDPYQPVESKLRITRGILGVMAEFRQPVGIITKNRLILRDADLLARLHEHRAVHALVSLTTLDAGLARLMEPRASAPAERLRVVRELSALGIPVSVMTAPIIPGINDHEIPRLLGAAKEAGAISAGYVLLKLPYQIKDLFLDWLRRHFPDRAAKVEAFVRESRGGALYDAAFHDRQRGTGERAEQIRATFKLFQRRHGLDGRIPPFADAFRRPGERSLFDAPEDGAGA